MMGRKGWHYRGYLPHFDGYDVAQHIVFSLIDALPAKSQSNGDDVLDRGHGSAILRNTRCAEIVQDALLHFNETRYGLRAWCIMPNHVHALVVTHTRPRHRPYCQIVEDLHGRKDQYGAGPARPSLGAGLFRPLHPR
jgi:hypothetical protein